MPLKLLGICNHELLNPEVRLRQPHKGKTISKEVTQAEGEESYILRESENSYEGIIRGKKELLSNRDQLGKHAFDL